MIDKETLPFGKRYGFVPIDIPFQIDTMDPVLRTELWNAYYLFIHQPGDRAESYKKTPFISLNQNLWVHFFKKAFDDFPQYDFQFGKFVRNFIEKDVWYKVYEFFEFVLRNIKNESLFQYPKFETYIVNKIKNNNSAYTLYNDKFIPITNETELNEIKSVQILAEKYELSGIQNHLNSSIELLSQKPNPDFRNSIKESISMVEVISRIIEPSENTLGKALNKLDKKQKINSTLKGGFERLYAYTNDKNGIRHALMEDDKVDFEDAKFFLVSCSAFTNYLTQKAINGNFLSDKK